MRNARGYLFSRAFQGSRRPRRPEGVRRGRRRSVVAAGPVAAALLLLSACGDSVAAGGRNAATNPATGIWVSNTVGGGNVSGAPPPKVGYKVPANKPPSTLPAGLTRTVAAVESAVTGGCWQDSHQGNLYGAYDQLFWWQGQCGDTVAQVTVELYPTVGAAGAEAHHVTANALLGRYREGAVLVDAFSNAPQSVLAQLGSVQGLTGVPGYGG